jgi:hypothetical protein
MVLPPLLLRPERQRQRRLPRVRYYYHGEGMTRLLRILRNALTLTSLLLCVASLGLWVRSYRYHDDFRVLFHDAGRVVDVTNLYGGLQVAKIENVDNRDGAWGWSWDQGWTATDLKWAPPNRRPWRDWQLFYGAGTVGNDQWLGFRLLTGHIGTSASSPFWSIRVPLWFLSIFFALPPAYWTIRRIMVRKLRPGHCLTCGYDLRATPERCPECGTIPTR